MEYHLMEEIGKSPSAQVWLARGSGDREFVLKIIKKWSPGGEAFREEVQVLQNLLLAGGCSRHFLCYIDSWEDDRNFYLATEYSPGIPLDRFIDSVIRGGLRPPSWGRVDNRYLLDVLIDLSLSVEEVHKRGVAHRDLKPSNILLDVKLRQVTLLDFGFSCFQPPNTLRPLCSPKPVGTPRYIAPEVVRKRVKNFYSADVYSLGCVFFRMLTGKDLIPGKKLSDLTHNILAGVTNPIVTDNPEMDELIKEMVQMDPLKRPSIAEVVQSLREMVVGPRDEPFRILEGPSPFG